MSYTNITSDYEPEFGSSAPSRDNGITHPDPVLLSSMTKAQRGAVCRYLARFAELDDAKIFYAYGLRGRVPCVGAEEVCSEPPLHIVCCMPRTPPGGHELYTRMPPHPPEFRGSAAAFLYSL